jgi:M6 family metalloprotease-like protein
MHHAMPKKTKPQRLPQRACIAPSQTVEKKRGFSKMKQWLTRFAVASLVGIALIVNTGCDNSKVLWKNYPTLWAKSTQKPWLTILCKVNDNNTEPAGLRDRANSFLTVGGMGQGNMADYYSDVSYGAISFVGSRVIGWYTAPFSTVDITTQTGRLAGAGNRGERVKECANAVPDADADFSAYQGIVMVVNILNDGGACWIGQAPITIHGKTYNLGCVVFDESGLITGFAAHEIGHGYGLVHSFDDTNCQYCDPFDIMSAMNTYRFSGANFPEMIANTGVGATDGPGLDAPNLLQLGWLPGNRIATYHIGASETSFTLTALSHPAGNHPLTVQIVGSDPNDIYTVEYRQTDGWDAGLPDNTVLIHEYKKSQNPWSFLERSAAPYSGEWLTGMVYANQTVGFNVKVTGINPGAGTATVSIGLPPFFNMKPHVKIVSPADGSTFSVGQPINLVAVATDFAGNTLPDADVLWQANGQTIGMGKQITTSFATSGQETITAIASDQGGSVNQMVTVNIVQQPTPTPLPKPTVQILLPTPGQGYIVIEQGTLTISLAANASSGVVAFKWSDALGIIKDTKANDTLVVTPTPQQLACGNTNDTITLKVTDSHQQSATASVKIIIQRACIT